MLLLALTVEIERCFYFLLRGRLVEAYVAYVAQQGEVDAACHVLFVVGHELKQRGIVVAGDGHATVVVEDETHALTHAISGEACLHATEVELAHQSPGHSIAVKNGLALKGQRLEGMAHSMTQVKGLAQSLLSGVSADDALLHLHALGHHELQLGKMGLLNVEGEQLGEHVGGVDEPMLEHLGIAGKEVLTVHRLQKNCVENDRRSIAEHANLVFQSTEVEAGLATYRGIDHGKQCGGDVDEMNAALEGGCCEAAQIGHHAAAQIDEQRVARGSHALQLGPHMEHRLELLVLVARRNGNDMGLLHAAEVCYKGQTQLVGGLVGSEGEGEEDGVVVGVAELHLEEVDSAE